MHTNERLRALLRHYRDDDDIAGSRHVVLDSLDRQAGIRTGRPNPRFGQMRPHDGLLYPEGPHLPEGYVLARIKKHEEKVFEGPYIFWLGEPMKDRICCKMASRSHCGCRT